jgi:erythronate-4-phosphate dehydrogenase
MQIIADENIPLVDEAFTNLGKVRTLAGRNLSDADLGEAEILLVRSVTPVNEKLLAKSAIRFVGTATIGLDHIDLAYLHHQDIGFASAPGCNANAAAEYVISALLVIAERQNLALPSKTVGIIGCGNVGSRVFKKLTALNVNCLVYDPPQQEQPGLQPADFDYVDFETVLTADIITLHVPLEKNGRYPTYHLINEEVLSKLSNQVILINTSRGAVIDEAALLKQLTIQPEMTVILDVWQNEPNINPLLLQPVALGTPHIAGYSLDGKIRGTEMLYNAVCHYFQQTPVWQAQTSLPTPPLTRLVFSNQIDDSTAIHTAVMACYDIRRDDANLRCLKPTIQPGIFFDNLRKYYPLRREFNCVVIELPAEKSHLAKQLIGLGFQVDLR